VRIYSRKWNAYTCSIFTRQDATENECEALPGVAYPGVRDNRSTVNTKTGYDDDQPENEIQTALDCHTVSLEVLISSTRQKPLKY